MLSLRLFTSIRRVLPLLAFIALLDATPVDAAPIPISTILTTDLEVRFGPPSTPFADDPTFSGIFAVVRVDATITGLDVGESVRILAGDIVGGIFITQTLFEHVGGIFVPAFQTFTSTPPQFLVTGTGVDRINNNGLSFFFGLSGPAGATAELTSFIVSGYDAGGNPITIDALAPTAVPEPTSLLLLGSGIAGIAAKARRRKQRQANS